MMNPGFGMVEDWSELKRAYVACLLSMYSDIMEERWPSQYRIDEAIGYATVLGLSATEVDNLQSVLMD